jgi:hypothetical protein
MIIRKSVMEGNYLKMSLSEKWPYFVLLASLLYMIVVYGILSGTRAFNFDEFQVFYASAAMERGKALYYDQIGRHFPLFNITIGLLIRVIGNHSTTIIAARYFVLLTSLVGLLFVYKTAAFLWEKNTGILAVLLALSEVVFMVKGIEIRHDVFNMTFTVIGLYYIVRYLDEERIIQLLKSAVFLGMAIASTQKAIVWTGGCILGVTCYLVHKRSYRNLLMVYSLYLLLIPVPLAISIAYLLLTTPESLRAFFEYPVIDVLNSFLPLTEDLVPFPYSKNEWFQRLLFQNHLFYALSIGSVLTLIALWVKTNTRRIVVATTAAVGVAFFITAKRPFDQSLLPTVAVLAIAVSGFLTDGFIEFNKGTYTKIGFSGVFILLLFIWPQFFLYGELRNKMAKQVENISFCLNNLREGEKVLCFTQNQIFFDPVLRLRNDECGKTLYDYDTVCFEEKMINQQCKIVINDYRTKLVSQEMKDKIKENYLAIGTSDILVPGFKIPPGKTLNKEIWIKGYYYSPSLSLSIDGRQIRGNVIKLKQKRYLFRNITNSPIFLVYVFKRQGMINGT